MPFTYHKQKINKKNPLKRLLPRHLLLASGILLLVIAALFIDASSVLDIHLHDNYYIIAHQQHIYLFAILSLALWALHWFYRRLLFLRWLNWLHVLLSFVSLWVLTVALLTNVHEYTDTANSNFEAMQQLQEAVAIVVLLLLLAQIIFVTHFLLGLFRKKRAV
ncbi:hypothetical protein [Phnomibacter sp. MR]|uniref:hypothetical protein n=1 Tax=Phnomibacter sp. MR TaxID=3042318 RepID=UPI003A80A9EC